MPTSSALKMPVLFSGMAHVQLRQQKADQTVTRNVNLKTFTSAVLKL